MRATLPPGYSRAELNQLLAATRTRHFAAGTWLSRDGAPGSSCFLIATGAVEVVKYLDGEEHVFATLRPGSLVGQTALVEGALRSASVRAISATTALEIRGKTLQRFVQQGSPLAQRLQEPGPRLHPSRHRRMGCASGARGLPAAFRQEAADVGSSSSLPIPPSAC